MRAQIDIQRVGLEGQGVGTDDSGNIFFVERALPGDTVLVEFAEDARRYRDATLIEVVKPSPERREPVCPYFQKCGGCDWLNWDYAAQLRGKEAILRHLFERNQIVPESQPPMIGADEILGYRNRIQLRREAGRLGFFARRSHDIIDIDRCAVAHPALNEALGKLRAESSAPHMTKIELGLDREGKVGRWENAPHGAGGFGQIHSAQNEKLRKLVADRVAGSDRVLELYSGSGNLTFAFSDRVGATLAVEIHAAAVEAGRAQARAGNTTNVTFLQAPVSPVLRRRLPAGWDNYDTLLLDPPRAGVGSLAPYVHPGVKTIVFVSCSPVEFSKSLGKIKKDFRFVEAQALDMFPHTRHIEFLATLKRV